MPRFELTRYPSDSIMSRLYILVFRPPELLSEKPIEDSSNSPEMQPLYFSQLQRHLTVCTQSYANFKICFISSRFSAK